MAILDEVSDIKSHKNVDDETLAQAKVGEDIEEIPDDGISEVFEAVILDKNVDETQGLGSTDGATVPGNNGKFHNCKKCDYKFKSKG